jgi:hypothetical protein
MRRKLSKDKHQQLVGEALCFKRCFVGYVNMLLWFSEKVKIKYIFFEAFMNWNISGSHSKELRKPLCCHRRLKKQIGSANQNPILSTRTPHIL